MKFALSIHVLKATLIALMVFVWTNISTQASTPENLQIYLLMGQSNMVGQDATTLSQQVDNPRILSLNNDNQWVVAREPMHYRGTGIGPGISFAQEMLKTEPNANIGLVPCAVSGTPLNQWVKGSVNYKNTMRRAKTAALAGTIRGILWHQGEGDSINPAYAETYETRLAQVFQDLRQDLNQPNLPIVVGQMGEFVSVARFPLIDTIRQALLHLPADLERVGFAPSTGLVDKGDKLHFNAVSEQTFGVRYAQEMQRLQTIPTLDNATFTFGLGRAIDNLRLVGNDSDGDTLSYSITSGMLPDGVTLNSDGSFSGQPTATTSATGISVTAQVSDGDDGVGTAPLTIIVKDFNLIVDTSADSTPGSETDTDGATSLREAVTYANAKPGADIITFAPEVFNGPQTITLLSSLPSLDEDVNFIGPGAKLLTLRATEPKGFELIQVNGGVTTLFSGLTLSDTLTSIANSGTVNINSCAFINNSTAVDNQGSINLSNSTLSGGSIGISNTGSMTLINCTLSGNTQSGISNQGTLDVTNCTLSGNEVGIANSAALTLKNTLVVGNTTSDVNGAFSDGGHNITTGTALEVGLDPTGLQDNGGPTQTIALVDTRGVAVNAGDNGLVPGTLFYDQRGTGYKRVHGDVVDVGAFELRLNGAPTDILLSKNKIAENAGADMWVGDFAVVDPDFGDTFTLELPTGVDDNALFSIGLGKQLRAKASFDYETKDSYLVTVRATDSGGLSIIKQFAITITESTKPTISIGIPTANQRIFIQNFVRSSIRGVASDNVGIYGVKVRLSRKRGTTNYFWDGYDFVTGQTVISAGVSASGYGATQINWAVGGQLPPVHKLDAGLYQLRVYAIDMTGNQSEYIDQSFTLKSDVTGPTLTINSPIVNQKMLISSFLSGGVSGTASDAEGVVIVKVRLSRKNGSSNVYWNGTDFTTAPSFVDADKTGTTNATWKFLSRVPSTEKLSSGVYAVAVYAMDEAGNQSEMLSTQFTLGTDYTPPTVSIAMPLVNQLLDINTLGLGNLTGSADDNLGVTSVKLKLQRKRGTELQYWNGSDFTTTVALVNALLTPGTGTAVTWRLNQPIPVAKWDKGSYTLYASAYDAAGNTFTSTGRAFTVTGMAAISASSVSAGGS